ncbi:MAG: hypothetical protein ABIS36_18685 [Chryseolinea sp.]
MKINPFSFLGMLDLEIHDQNSSPYQMLKIFLLMKYDLMEFTLP